MSYARREHLQPVVASHDQTLPFVQTSSAYSDAIQLRPEYALSRSTSATPIRSVALGEKMAMRGASTCGATNSATSSTTSSTTNTMRRVANMSVVDAVMNGTGAGFDDGLALEGREDETGVFGVFGKKKKAYEKGKPPEPDAKKKGMFADVTMENAVALKNKAKEKAVALKNETKDKAFEARVSLAKTRSHFHFDYVVVGRNRKDKAGFPIKKTIDVKYEVEVKVKDAPETQRFAVMAVTVDKKVVGQSLVREPSKPVIGNFPHDIKALTALTARYNYEYVNDDPEGKEERSEFYLSEEAADQDKQLTIDTKNASKFALLMGHSMANKQLEDALPAFFGEDKAEFDESGKYPDLVAKVKSLMFNPNIKMDLDPTKPYFVNLGSLTYKYRDTTDDKKKMHPICGFLVTDIPRGESQPTLTKSDGTPEMITMNNREVPVTLDQLFSCVLHPVNYYVAPGKTAEDAGQLRLGDHQFYVPRDTNISELEDGYSKPKSNVHKYYVNVEGKLQKALPIALERSHIDMRLLWHAATLGSTVKNFYNHAPASTQLRMHPIFFKGSGVVAEGTLSEPITTSALLEDGDGFYKPTDATDECDITIDDIFARLQSDSSACEAALHEESHPCHGSF